MIEQQQRCQTEQICSELTGMYIDLATDFALPGLCV